MTIRTMTARDYDAVYSLWLHTDGMGLNNVDDSREGVEKYLRRNPTTCFVALDGDALVGAILSGHDGRRGYISHTAVAKARRGEGIGRALVRAALSAMESEGIAKVALVAFKRNQQGNAFWERMGFSLREDLNYRNIALKALERIDT